MPETSPEMLPGEAGPLPMEVGGPPVTEAEVLGVWRRWVREDNERRGRNDPLPTELPRPNEKGKTPMFSFRAPMLRMLRARARADREQVSLSVVINDFLERYGQGELGSVPRMVVPPAPGPRRSRRSDR
ncbi:hypothetical protein HF998_00460 [Cellulomonas hominis]|nr:hypothetical protein [Cellulomonas hominis]MBB5474608.1 hypothetical protein [Cellulomonas hominis]NKY05481.1 hypothetical protein [Cellulomonas hominis]